MLPIRFSRKGLSLVEVSVTVGILLLLFGAISLIYQSSARVWRKVDSRTALLRETQVVARNLERALEVTHPFGLARADNAVAYLSATDASNTLETDAEGRLLWKRFVILYVDPAGRIRRRYLPLAGPTPDPPSFQQETGASLEDFLTGPEPTDSYLTHTGVITRFELKNSGDYGSLYELIVEGEEPVGTGRKEHMSLRTKVSIRNY